MYKLQDLQASMFEVPSTRLKLFIGAPGLRTRMELRRFLSESQDRNCVRSASHTPEAQAGGNFLVVFGQRRFHHISLVEVSGVHFFGLYTLQQSRGTRKAKHSVKAFEIATYIYLPDR